MLSNIVGFLFVVLIVTLVRFGVASLVDYPIDHDWRAGLDRVIFATGCYTALRLFPIFEERNGI